MTKRGWFKPHHSAAAVCSLHALVLGACHRATADPLSCSKACMHTRRGAGRARVCAGRACALCVRVVSPTAKRGCVGAVGFGRSATPMVSPRSSTISHRVFRGCRMRHWLAEGRAGLGAGGVAGQGGGVGRGPPRPLVNVQKVKPGFYTVTAYRYHHQREMAANRGSRSREL